MISKNAIKPIIGICCALGALGIAASSANADDMSKMNKDMSMTQPADPNAVDYSMLYNVTFNNADLQSAKSYHYSDKQVAQILIIARNSDCKFSEILQRVVQKGSIPVVATINGVGLGKLNNVTKTEDDIAAYQSAYAVIGEGGMRVSRPELMPQTPPAPKM